MHPLPVRLAVVVKDTTFVEQLIEDPALGAFPTTTLPAPTFAPAATGMPLLQPLSVASALKATKDINGSMGIHAQALKKTR